MLFYISDSICIDAADILIELKYIRDLLSTPLKLTVEVKDGQKDGREDGQKDDHIPAWDILDEEFESFPVMPEFNEDVNHSVSNVSTTYPNLTYVRNTTVQMNMTFVELMTYYKDEQTIAFALTLSFVSCLIVGLIVLSIWFCCFRNKKTKANSKATFDDSSIALEQFDEGEIPELDLQVVPELPQSEPPKPEISKKPTPVPCPTVPQRYSSIPRRIPFSPQSPPPTHHVKPEHLRKKFVTEI